MDIGNNQPQSFKIKLAIPPSLKYDAQTIGLSVRAKLNMNMPLRCKFDLEFLGAGLTVDYTDI